MSLYTQSWSGTAAGGPGTIVSATSGSPVTAGSTILLLGYFDEGHDTPSTPTDNRGNTYSSIPLGAAANVGGLLAWQAYDVLAGVTDVSIDGWAFCCPSCLPESFASILCFELPGLLTTNPFDVAASQSDAPSTIATTPSLPTPSHTNELVVGITATDEVASSVDAPFTSFTTYSSYGGISVAYTTISTISEPQATFNYPTSSIAVTAIIGFKQAGSDQGAFLQVL